MSRRFGTERCFTAINNLIAAGSGTVVLVAPESNIALSPKYAVIGAHGGGPFEVDITSNGVSFLHIHIPSNDSIPVDWPNGFELAIGSGIEVIPSTNDGSVTLYYSKYDESPGITKVAARAASYVNTDGEPKATRLPSDGGGGDQS